ncbi:MAG: hypothetical protein ABS948_11875 [Solibacillus sp.]
MANPTMKEVATANPVTAAQVSTAIGQHMKSVIPQKIYVGPNILGLPTYTVMEKEFTGHIKGFISECPAIKKLFVPILDMAATENRIKKKGTLENHHFQTILAFKATGKGEQK